MDPVCTVVMLVWNRPEYTDAALASISRHPPGLPWEFIVVDNGSDAPARDVIDRWAAAGVVHKVVRLAENLGTSAGFNAGFAAAHPASRYLTKLDSDMLVLGPGWLAHVVTVLEEAPRAGLAAGDVVNLRALRAAPVLRLPSGLLVKSWRRHRAGGGAMTFPRSVFSTDGGFRTDYPAGLQLMPDDFELYYRLHGRGLEGYYACAARFQHQTHLDTVNAATRQAKRRQYELLRTRFFAYAKRGTPFAPFVGAAHLSWTSGSARRGIELTAAIDAAADETIHCSVALAPRGDAAPGAGREVSVETVVLAAGRTTVTIPFDAPADLPGALAVEVVLRREKAGDVIDRYPAGVLAEG